MRPEQEQEYRDEAERLAELPRDMQRKAMALIRAPAAEPKVSKRDRDAARERADRTIPLHLRPGNTPCTN